MAASYAQLTTIETREEFAAELLELLDELGFKATSWQTTSIPYALVMIGAHLAAIWSEQRAFAATQPYIGQAKQDALTLLAASHFQRTRREAIAAQYRETFTTASGEGPHSIDVGDIVVTDAEGHTFRNVEGLGVVYPVSLTSAAPVTMLVEAEEPGSDANVPDDTITQMVTTYAGVTCTNDDDPTSGTSVVTVGADEESDPTLETACETQWGDLTIQTVRAGTISACINAAPGIAKAKIDDTNPRGAGTLDAYVAGLASVAGGSDVTAAQTALDARFFGNSGAPPRCQALAAAGHAIPVTGTVYYDSNYSAADVEAAVLAALLAFTRATPIGGWDYTPGPANIVRVNDIEDAIKQAAIGAAKPVKTVTITTPAADETIGAFEVVIPGLPTLVYTPVTAA